MVFLLQPLPRDNIHWTAMTLRSFGVAIGLGGLLVVLVVMLLENIIAKIRFDVSPDRVDMVG